VRAGAGAELDEDREDDGAGEVEGSAGVKPDDALVGEVDVGLGLGQRRRVSSAKRRRKKRKRTGLISSESELPIVASQCSSGLNGRKGAEERERKSDALLNLESRADLRRAVIEGRKSGRASLP
jgi:hypothetical protein